MIERGRRRVTQECASAFALRPEWGEGGERAALYREAATIGRGGGSWPKSRSLSPRFQPNWAQTNAPGRAPGAGVKTVNLSRCARPGGRDCVYESRTWKSFRGLTATLQLQGGRIEWRSGVGEATARVLGFNVLERIQERETLKADGRFPSAAAQNRMQEEEAADFRLRPDAPCLDAGTNRTDLAVTILPGLPRILDGNNDGIARGDLGAYEFNPYPTRWSDRFVDGAPTFRLCALGVSAHPPDWGKEVAELALSPDGRRGPPSDHNRSPVAAAGPAGWGQGRVRAEGAEAAERKGESGWLRRD